MEFPTASRGTRFVETQRNMRIALIKVKISVFLSELGCSFSKNALTWRFLRVLRPPSPLIKRIPALSVRDMLRTASKLLPNRLISSTLESASLESLETRNDALRLQLLRKSGEPTSLLIPLVWLRDHCKGPSCYNHSTNQRTSNMVNIFEEAEIDCQEDVSVKEQKTLHIRWKSGLKSQFDIDELLISSVRRNLPSTSDYITSWDAALEEIPRVQLSTLSFSEFSQLFVRYGLVIIDGVEANPEATEKLCREIAPIHDTYYGAFWVFSNESKGEDYHEDTAYGQEAIGPHTDGTYFDQTPGIQVFHCLRPAEVGGDTLLVDGKRCVELLKEEDPEGFELLTKKLVVHHYLEGDTADGNALTTVSRHRPVIELDAAGNLLQLRFNPYDRAPLRSLSFDDPASARETLHFYKAYSRLSRICHDPINTVRTSLQPGSVIFIDNFRVLHSRTAFKGFRQMSGCYLSRDNFMAKARPYLDGCIRYTV